MCKLLGSIIIFCICTQWLHAKDAELPAYNDDMAVLYFDHTGSKHEVLLFKELEKQLMANWEQAVKDQEHRKSKGIEEGDPPPKPLIIGLKAGSFGKDTEKKLAKELKTANRRYKDMIEKHIAKAKATIDASGFKKQSVRVTADGENLLSNGSFENALLDWTLSNPKKPIAQVIDGGNDGEKCLFFTADKESVSSVVTAKLPVSEKALSCTVNYKIKLENVVTAGQSWQTLMIKFKQFDAKGEMIAEKGVGTHAGSEDWKDYSKTIQIVRACKSIQLILEFHKPKGSIWLDKMEIIPKQ